MSSQLFPLSMAVPKEHKDILIDNHLNFKNPSNKCIS